MLHSFMTAAAEKGYTQDEYRSDAGKIARAHIDFARKYRMDGIFVDVDTCMEVGALGVELDLPLNEPARVSKGLSGGIEACIEAMDRERLKSYDRIQIKLEAVNRIKNEIGDEFVLRGNADQGPFSLAMLTLGITEFMMHLYDDPDRVRILIDRAFDVHLEFHRMMMEAGADITSFGDSSCGPDLISPDMYRTFSFPWHKRLSESLHCESILTVCHICGNLDMILEDVTAAGFPAIEVDSKTDISAAASIMKDKALFFGPLDPSGVFYTGDPKLVAEKTRETLSCFPHGGLIIGSGCALPAGIREENLYAFAATVEGASEV